MKLTNRFNLSQEWVNAVTSRKPTLEELHITELIEPPRIRQLMMRHWDELEEDVSERVWAINGQAIHEFFARREAPNSLAEEPLRAQMGGKIILGKPDLLAGKDLTDHKTTSVWTVIFESKIYGRKDWFYQINCYKWLYNTYRFEVKSLNIDCLLRDWTKNSYLKSPDTYPPVPARKYANIPIMPNIDEYIAERVELHKQAESMSDDDLPMCSDEERWIAPSQWRVEKEGRKSAVRVKGLDGLPFTEETANIYLENMEDKKKKGCSVVERKGGYRRCMLEGGFCPVRNVCKYAVGE